MNIKMDLLQYFWTIGIILDIALCSTQDAYFYLGCYGNVFKGCKFAGSFSDMNVQECDKKCTGFMFIAIFRGTSCYCCHDNNFSVSSKTIATLCNKECPTDTTRLCGGIVSYTSVYSRQMPTMNVYTTKKPMEVSTKIETQTTTLLPSPITTTHVVPCPSSTHLPLCPSSTQLPLCPSSTQLPLCPTSSTDISVSKMVLSLNSTKFIVSTNNVDGRRVLKSQACYNVIVVTDFSAQSSEAASSISEMLLVPKSNISAFKATKISTPDDRLSAQAIGYSGIVLFLLPFTLIAWLDLISILKLRQRIKVLDQ